MSNLVLAHRDCNNNVSGMTLTEKVRHAVEMRIMNAKIEAADKVMESVGQLFKKEEPMLCQACQEVECECSTQEECQCVKPEPVQSKKYTINCLKCGGLLYK